MLFSVLVPDDVPQVLNCVHKFLSSPFGLYLINLITCGEHFEITVDKIMKFACWVFCRV